MGGDLKLVPILPRKNKIKEGFLKEILRIIQINKV